MTEAAIAELEAASRIFMESQHNITSEQRHAAETIIMNFRKTKTPYVICQQILEKSSVQLLQFEAADVLKHALVTEWDTIQEQDKLTLRQYLLNYVLHRNPPSFIREKILQVVAIMIKRASTTDMGVERGYILVEMQKMLASGDIQQQFLACRIIYTIMQEYVTTVKSDDTGMTFDEHFRAKKQFELVDLKKIFCMVMVAFEELLNKLDLTQITHVHLLHEYFAIEEQILMWGYVSPWLPKRLISIFETINKTDQNPALRLSSQWESVFIQNTKVTDMFFGVYWKVRDIPELQQKAMTCIVQLSSLNGPLMNNNSANRLEYVARFIRMFVELFSQLELKCCEAIGVATALRKLLLYNLPDGIATDVREQFLQFMYMVTSKLIQLSTKEEINGTEDPVFMEALDKVFEAWCLVFQARESFPGDKIKLYAIEIFKEYVLSHLSPPEGFRTVAAGGGADNANGITMNGGETEEIDENEQPDCERFKEQLILIGTFSREQSYQSISFVCTLLENRTAELQRILQRMYVNRSEDKAITTIYEDIHWLLLISGHIVSMEAMGEQPMIPSEIMSQSCERMAAGNTDIDLSLKLLGTPSQCIGDFSNVAAENCVDNVIRLIAAVFRLCEIENNAIESEMKCALSPEISSNCMWFLKMWSESYLLMLPIHYEKISEPLKAAFGLDTPCANWVVGYILKKICVNVQSFYSEKEVIDQSIQLFLSLVKQKHKCATIFNSEYFKPIFQLRLLAIPKMSLIKGLTITASCISDKNAREIYMQELLTPIVEKFTKQEWQQVMNNTNDTGKSTVAIRIAFILDEIRACNSGATSETAIKIYTAFEPIYTNLGDIINIFYNYQSVIIAVLELVCEILQNLIYLTTHKIYEICMHIIMIYGKHKGGNRVSIVESTTEDSCDDLMLLLKLMDRLLSTNYFGVLDDAENTISATEVCVYGFQYIMPSITMDLLKFPTLCVKYYQTITVFIEATSKKISSVSPELLSNMLQSIQLGLNTFSTDVQSICFDFLQILVTGAQIKDTPEEYVYNAVMPFVKIILEMILTQKVDTDNKTECAKALFALICCYKEYYCQCVQLILQTVTNPEHAERLRTEFTDLTTNIDLVYNRISQNLFVEKFERFLSNISFVFN